MGGLRSLLTSPADDSLLREALREGGLTIQTFNDTGQIEFRTVLQLDGDVLLQIAPDSPLSDERRIALAEQHWNEVEAKTHALNEALSRLEGLANKAKRYLGLAMKGVRNAGFAGTLLSLGLQHQKLFIFAALTTAVAHYGRPIIVRLLVRYILGHLKTWATASIGSAQDAATPAVRIESV